MTLQLHWIEVTMAPEKTARMAVLGDLRAYVERHESRGDGAEELEWWDWFVQDETDGDFGPLAEGVSWRSEQEALELAEAALAIYARHAAAALHRPYEKEKA